MKGRLILDKAEREKVGTDLFSFEKRIFWVVSGSLRRKLIKRVWLQYLCLKDDNFQEGFCRANAVPMAIKWFKRTYPDFIW